MKRIALAAAVFAVAACGPRTDDQVTVDTTSPALMPAPADTADSLVRDSLMRDSLMRDSIRRAQP